jgi:autotransporter-associated beta strand protein
LVSFPVNLAGTVGRAAARRFDNGGDFNFTGTVNLYAPPGFNRPRLQPFNKMIKPSIAAAGKKIRCGLLAGLLGLMAGNGQQLAFPGAQGFGQYATGGRNGTVYHVTTLADSGAGSFRDAVSQGNRTIVFDVGGYINLASAVTASSGLTIAGQTAPGGGIGLMGNELSFYGKNNIICRHLRVRQGGSSTGSSAINIGASSSANPATNMIFDHISVEFGQWDSIDAVQTAYVTVQNSIIADPINQQFGAHVEGFNLTWYGNLWVNCHNRQPLCKADTIFINNVVYDYQAAYTTGDTGAAHNHDIINNYFICGPSSSAAGDDFFQINGTPQNLYFTGNLRDSDKNGVLGGSTTTPSPDNNGRTGNVLTAPWSSLTPTIPTYPTVTAYRGDVSRAGAFPRDPLDALVIGQVTSLGTAGALVTSPGATGLDNSGYGTIEGGTALVDSDQDGMPDIWENATGSDPQAANSLTNTADGYTLLEHYLNWMAAPHAFVQTNATDLDLWPYTPGFTNSAAYTFAGFTNCTVTLTNSHFAHVVPTPGFTGLAGFNFIVAGSDGSVMTNTMGLLVSVTYLPKNLVWRGDGSANLWDTTNTADWFNGGDLVTFHASDSVTFDDSGSASPAINLTGTVAPASVVVAADQNYTLGGSGAINGTGSFVKSGAGTLQVNNNNTFTGPLTVNGGLIQYNNGAYLGSGNITLNGATLSFSLSASGTYLTLANSLSVSPGTTNTLIMSQRETLSGTVTNSGTLNLVAPSNLGGTRDYLSGSWSQFAGTLNLSGGAMLQCQVQGGSFNGFNNGSVTISNETLGVYGTPGGETINIGALSGNSGAILAGSGYGYGGLVTWQVGGLNLNTTFAGAIQNGSLGSAALTKVGAGTLTLGGTSTHTGNTAVSNGTLRVTGSFSSSPVTVASGAALGGTGVLGGGVTILSGGIISPGLGGGSSGPLTVSNSLTLTAPILNFDLSGSPAGTNDQIVLPGGLLTMSGVQTYNFNLVDDALGAGTYNLISGATNNAASGVSFANNLPGSTRQTFAMQRPASGSGSGYVQLVVTGSAGSLVWQGTNGSAWDNATTNWLNGSAADAFYNLDLVRFDDTATNGTVSIAGVVQPATVLVTNSARAYTLGGGVLGGITRLVKSGPGMLILNSSNSFSGGTFVNGGTLQLVSNGYAGGTGPIALNGATLYLNGIGTGTTITCAGTNTLQTSGQPYASFNLQGSGWLNLAVGNGGVFSPSGDWSGFAGTIYFTTGNWVREMNTATFGSANAVWNFGSAGGLFNKSGGATICLGALFGGAGAALSGASTATASLTTYVVGGINTNSVFNGTISDGGAAATALVFNGPGSITLTGNNTYSGGTTVNAGALIVNNAAGSGTGSGGGSINSGAALGGNGTIAGQVSLAAGATLAPGSSGSGTLTILNDLGLNNASVLQFQLGTNNGQVAVTGDLTLGGTLNISNAGGFGPGTYTLFTYGGALSVGTLTIGATPGNYTYAVDTSVPGQVNLVVSLPQFGNIRATLNGLVMSGSGGTANASYYLLTATNLAAPLNAWTRMATNQFDAGGNFNFTNPAGPNSPRRFYRLQMP